MAALAGALKQQGYRVTGTDEHVYPPISDFLAAQGIAYTQGYAAGNIPQDTDLVVVGNVIREANPEAAEMRRRELPFLSMAEAVYQYAIRGRFTLAVVGTHGKTTTSTLAAHTLVHAGQDPGYLIGGIPMNLPANFATGQGQNFVIEGDEYDTAYFDKTPKFFKYRPSGVIFTSLEFDHADIYPDLEAIRRHFRALIQGLPPKGFLVACWDDPNVRELLPLAPCPVVTYGSQPGADCRQEVLAITPEGTRFRVTWGQEQQEWTIPLAGDYNAANATAVMIAARRMGLSANAVQSAFSAFQGVKRRQEVRGVANGVTVIDDFAHHPTAVRLTIAAVRQKYPHGTLWAVFEPRSYTARHKRFQEDWGRAFPLADRVLLAPPYQPPGSPASDLLDVAQVARDVNTQGGQAQTCTNTQAILDILASQAHPGDTVLVMSNGGFDNIHQRLLDALAKRT